MRSVTAIPVSSPAPPLPGPGSLCFTAIQTQPEIPVIKSAFFVIRIAVAWLLGILLFAALWSEIPLLAAWSGRSRWPA